MPKISYSIKNPEMDKEIQEIFRSNKLVKTLLCYKLKGKSYNILLIHNPEKVMLKSKVTYNTSKHGRLSVVAQCKKKICIIVDTRAPRALIKHIASFHNLSWWDRFRNLKTFNGSKVGHQVTEKKWYSDVYKIYTYTPCSWYEAMMLAKP